MALAPTWIGAETLRAKLPHLGGKRRLETPVQCDAQREDWREGLTTKYDNPCGSTSGRGKAFEMEGEGRCERGGRSSKMGVLGVNGDSTVYTVPMSNVVRSCKSCNDR